MSFGYAEYLTGCSQYCVQPTCTDDKTYPEAKWFDEGRLNLIGDAITKQDVKADENGSDYTAPIK
jgi:hypothetical protein